jgi:uncharacterized protein YlxP (DUF503 family)
VVVLALSLELHLPACRSLKDRRAAVRPILDGVRHRFRISAAEVGFQEKWQRARLGFAVVAGTEGQAVEVMDNVERFVWSFPEVEVGAIERHWLDTDAD